MTGAQIRTRLSIRREQPLARNWCQTGVFQRPILTDQILIFEHGIATHQQGDLRAAGQCPHGISTVGLLEGVAQLFEDRCQTRRRYPTGASLADLHDTDWLRHAYFQNPSVGF